MGNFLGVDNQERDSVLINTHTHKILSPTELMNINIINQEFLMFVYSVKCGWMLLVGLKNQSSCRARGEGVHASIQNKALFL